MSKAPAMPMYWDAYLGDTTHLTTEEHGAYLLLLAAMWRRDGAVPDDDKDNARIIGLTPSKWRRVKARLLETLPGLKVENGCLTHEKLTKIWEKTQEKIAKNRANGTLGGRPKSRENKGLAKANGSLSLNPNESIPDPEPVITPTPTVPPSDCARATTDPPAEQPQQDKPVSQQKPTPAVEPDDDQLLADVMKAVGLDGHEGHHYWLPPTSTIHVGKWRRDLGLTYHQILAAAKESRNRHTEPPRGPKALDGVMKAMASVIHAPPMTPAANPPPKPGKWRNIAAQFEAQDPTRRAAT